ncbi:MAG: flagellar basal body P-ring formation chaperone FlgA [Chromatocurvus sp.]
MTDFWRSTAQCMALSGLLISTATAATLHPLADIANRAAAAARASAADAGYNNVAVQVRPLDQRLRLAKCEQSLTTLIAQTSRPLGPVSVGVRCNGSAPWTLYVRTEVSAQLTLPVLTRTVPRGAIIADNDLEMVSRAISKDPGALILDPEAIIGLETRRALPAGSTLHHNQLVAPVLVERGQNVTLVAGSHGLQVRMQGKAMANAAAGERLMVTNQRSGRRVEGVVNPDGTVHIQ